MHNEKSPYDANSPFYNHNIPQQNPGQYGQPVQQPRTYPAGGYIPNPYPPQPQAPKKNTTRIVVLWIALIVLILCAAALFVLLVLPALTGESIITPSSISSSSGSSVSSSSSGLLGTGFGAGTSSSSGTSAVPPAVVTWKQVSSETITVPDTWPTNFDTTHSVYQQLERNVPAQTQTDSRRVEVEVIENGYIYYHWCRNARFAPKEPINRTANTVASAEFHTFHAYYSTRGLMESGNHIDATYHAGSETDNPSENGAYHQPNNSVCCDSYWYHPLEVTTYRVTTYEAEYD